MIKNNTTKPTKNEETLFDWVVKSIDLLVHNSISDTIILSSYKLNSVLKNTYGVNIRIDKIGRTLSKWATAKKLKRLTTNIPKYQLSVTQYKNFQKIKLEEQPQKS